MQLHPVRAERRGVDHVRTRVEIFILDAADEVRVFQAKYLRAHAGRQTAALQQHSGGSVQNGDLVFNDSRQTAHAADSSKKIIRKVIIQWLFGKSEEKMAVGHYRKIEWDFIGKLFYNTQPIHQGACARKL